MHVSVFWTFAPLLAVASGGAGFAPGFESIRAADLDADLEYLASPALEGRDTPSAGLELAARRIAARFEAAGLVPCADSATHWKEITGKDLEGGAPADGNASGQSTAVRGTFLRPFKLPLSQADPASALALVGGSTAGAGAAKERTFTLGVDFVPVSGLEGDATGELVFAGFGIDSKQDRYSDLDGLELRAKIALIVEGEPTHARAFDGPQVTRAASLWRKVDALGQAGVKAVIVVRRPPAATKGDKTDKTDKKKEGDEPVQFGFRSTWADWVGEPRDEHPRTRVPVLEVSRACAQALCGSDVLELAQKIERGMKPQRLKLDGVTVRLASKTKETSAAIQNVVGVVRGTDLADEYVVVGAHYDHVGVDSRGRIGLGADDNASGTSAMLELAEALAIAGPRRSVICCAFAGEEDGLLGSKAFCQKLPVERARVVAMINMDMIGRGDASEVAVLGIQQNPTLEKLLQRARSARTSGVTKVVVRQGEELFARSDHYSFHQIGVPALFFFEGLPIERNKDYHTWRDTPDLVDRDKLLSTARFVFNTTWLLSTDDERPPAPRE